VYPSVLRAGSPGTHLAEPPPKLIVIEPFSPPVVSEQVVKRSKIVKEKTAKNLILFIKNSSKSLNFDRKSIF
jgi:hypothetical protein